MRTKKELIKNKEMLERDNSGIEKAGINYSSKYKQGWYNCLLWVLKERL